MDSLTAQRLAVLAGGELSPGLPPERPVTGVSVDSRQTPGGAAFFALAGTRRDGHDFVAQALKAGAALAVVARRWAPSAPTEAPLLIVDEPLETLQKLAAWWRTRIAGKVVAITGSNGKTIVKDALVTVLSCLHSCAGNPGSFNSQLGVPLATLRMPREVDFALLEAGISAPGEMDRLERILRPDYGILTNIGWAHVAAFGTRDEICREKMRLYRNIARSGWVLVPSETPQVEKLLPTLGCRVVRLGEASEEIPLIESRRAVRDKICLTVRFPGGERLTLPILTPSLEVAVDVEIAVAAGYLLGAGPVEIEAALTDYQPSTTRMEIWRSPRGITLINDSCSADPLSVQAALSSLESFPAAGRHVFVFGGMRELGSYAEEAHAQIGTTAAQSGVHLLVAVGGQTLQATTAAFRAASPGGEILHCPSSVEVAGELVPRLGDGDTVLVKGPRKAGIEQVAREIVEAMAPSRLIVDVQAIGDNVSQFRRLLGPRVRLMAMVKALAYGTDAIRLSLELQRIGVDELGVSTADEGSLLRRSGIHLPIIVMLSMAAEAAKVLHYRLTPVVYSPELVRPLADAAGAQGATLDVHLKVDTGMGRLGVMPEELVALARSVVETRVLRPVGLMTHFAVAEDPAQDDFTGRQLAAFGESIAALRKLGLRDIVCHASATAGAVRFPEAHFDMVRIGLGLYGIHPSAATAARLDLRLAISLVSRIIEERVMGAAQRLGYGGTFVVPHDGFRVGVVPLGYHDGIPLNLSNVGYTLVNGRRADIVGRISMDSMLVNLSEIPDAGCGSDVVIYGEYAGYVLRPEEAARISGTIPYELMARLGPRVQRVFLGE